MNAGGTMLRVYAALKERLMTGGFAPGERLDPAVLAIDLASSATPVRDALQRLTGERLLDNPHRDGFRQPALSEASLRDLYDWSHQLSLIALDSAARCGRLPAKPPESSLDSAVDLMRALFTQIAEASPNHEHRAAMASLNDRIAIYRRREEELLSGIVPEVRILCDSVARADWHEARIMLNRFHRRRLRAVAAIVSRLRAR